MEIPRLPLAALEARQYDEGAVASMAVAAPHLPTPLSAREARTHSQRAQAAHTRQPLTARAYSYSSRNLGLTPRGSAMLGPRKDIQFDCTKGISTSPRSQDDVATRLTLAPIHSFRSMQLTAHNSHLGAIKEQSKPKADRHPEHMSACNASAITQSGNHQRLQEGFGLSASAPLRFKQTHSFEPDAQNINTNAQMLSKSRRTRSSCTRGSCTSSSWLKGASMCLDASDFNVDSTSPTSKHWWLKNAKGGLVLVSAESVMREGDPSCECVVARLVEECSEGKWLVEVVAMEGIGGTMPGSGTAQPVAIEEKVGAVMRVSAGAISRLSPGRGEWALVVSGDDAGFRGEVLNVEGSVSVLRGQRDAADCREARVRVLPSDLLTKC